MASNTFRSDPKRAAELAVILAQYLHLIGRPLPAARIAATVVEMQKVARSAKRWVEYECSYPTTEAQQARAAKRDERAQAKLNAALDEMASAGVVPTIELGGDPRGPCARLHIPGQRGDGRGDGFAVY